MSDKQTAAVEWLISQLQQTRDFQRVINEVNQSSTSVRNVLKEAKEMERDKSIQFALDCQEMFKDQIIEKYNETYGGNK